MHVTDGNTRSPRFPLLVLPGVHLLLLALSAGMEFAGSNGALARMVGVNPVGVAYGMAQESVPKLIAVFLIFGSVYWSFVGLIGWMAWQRRMNRISSALGAFFTVCCALFGIYGMKEVVDENSMMEVPVTPLIALQYVLLGLLIFGAFASAGCSLLAVIKGKAHATTQTLSSV